MKSIISGLFVAVLLLSLNTNAQKAVNDTNNSNVFRHSVGAAAGFTTGYGLAYRVTKSNFGLQAAFAPLKTKYESMYSAGITFMYVIDKRQYTDLFLYQANHYFYHSSDYSYYNQEKSKSQINTGLGIGMNFRLIDPFSFNMMIGYASYNSFNRLGLTVEASLFYVLQQ